MLRHKKRCLILGYIGHSNWGDDALLHILIGEIQHLSNEIEITIISDDKLGVEYLANHFPKFNIEFCNVPSKHFRKYDFVIYCGGNLLFHYDAQPSIAKITKKLFSAYRRYGIAYLTGTKFFAVSLGIGPFKNKWMEKAILKRLSFFEFVNVRDSCSLELAAKYGNKKMQAHQSQDGIFNISIPENKTQCTAIKKEIAVVIRDLPDQNKANRIFDTLQNTAKTVKDNHGLDIRWYSLQPENDARLLSKIRDNEEIWCWEPRNMKIEAFTESLRQSKIVLTMRMHGLFISALLSTPVIGIGLHKKFYHAASSFSEDLATVVDENSDSVFIANTANQLLEQRSKTKSLAAHELIATKIEVKNAYRTLARKLG